MTDAFLITRPEHDDTTHYLSHWSKETIATAEQRGLKVIDLHREKAIKKEFESRINKFSPKLVVLNGHGDENTVTGHKNQPLITIGENEKLLRSKIVYAISCRSALNLGPASVESGALSYSGYTDDFIFVYESESISRPLADKTAELFLKPSQVFIDSLLKGNTVAVAYQRSMNETKQHIFKVLASVTDAHLARFLWWNLKHFASHGNSSATI